MYAVSQLVIGEGNGGKLIEMLLHLQIIMLKYKLNFLIILYTMTVCLIIFNQSAYIEKLKNSKIKIENFKN